MLSVAEVVQSMVKRSPYLSDVLQLGIVNLSSLARSMHAEIETEVKKGVQTGAIIAALKRMEKNMMKKDEGSAKMKLDFGDMTVRSNLIEMTYANSDRLIEKEKRFMQKVLQDGNVFYNVSRGVKQTTFVLSNSIVADFREIFKGEQLLFSLFKLSSITINLPKDTVTTPGAYYSILKVLAWEGINIIEVLSTYTELTILFRSEDVDKAFSLLKRYFT